MNKHTDKTKENKTKENSHTLQERGKKKHRESETNRNQAKMVETS